MDLRPNFEMMRSIERKGPESFGSSSRQAKESDSSFEGLLSGSNSLPQSQRVAPDQGAGRTKAPQPPQQGGAPRQIPENVVNERTQSLEEAHVSTNQELRQPHVIKTAVKELSPEAMTRKALMQKFLKDMQEELGIEPEQLVEAFSSLTLEQLTRPPEENVELILTKLDLDPTQQEQARAMFEQMLKQTASASMAEYLKDSGQELSLEVLSQKELRQRQLNRSLDQMNDRFFMRGHYQSQPKQQNNETAPLSGTMPAMVATPAVKPEATGLSSEIQPSFQTTFDGSNTAGLNIEGMEVVKPVAYQPNSENQILEEVEAALPKAQAPNHSALNKLPDMNSEGQNQADLMNQFTQLNDSEGEPSDAETIESEGFDSKLFMGQSKGSSQTSGIKAGAASAFSAGPHVTEADEATNVKELINQTQFMLKKGGGEMKVNLQPEGMGQVQLKVALQNGQVNVEMVTETNEAKSLIEKGLGDLKATLSSHKLNVENVRIESASDISKHFDNLQEDAQRESARQFMEEFRHSNQQMRRGFIDLPGPRAYQSQTEDEGDNSYVTQGSNRNEQSAGRRRLNLVA